MTKESKLALIVGFALVLIVGVLISDHFSKASSVAVDNSLTEREPSEFGVATGDLNGPIMAPPPLTPAEEQARTAVVRAIPMQPLPGVRREEPAPIDTGDDLAAALDETNPLNIVMGAGRDELPDFEPVQPLAVQRRASGAPAGFDPVQPASDPRETTAPRAEPLPPPPVQAEPIVRHTVAENESLYKIAEHSYGNGNLWRVIRDANPKSVDEQGNVRAGVALIIPSRERVLGKPADKPAPQPEAKTTPKPAPQPKRQTPTVTKPATSAYALYTVKPNDNLSTIAQKLLKTSKRANDIAALNKLDDPDHLVVGMQLKIPAQ